MNHKKTKIFTLVLLTIYTAIMVYLMFFWRREAALSEYKYNFTPFKTILQPFEIYMKYRILHGFSIWNVLGNIGMFVSFGILLAILYNYKFIKSFITFEIGLLIFETAQLISRRGVFDIDDIMLNTIGFLIGYAIIKIINRFGRAKKIEKI